MTKYKTEDYKNSTIKYYLNNDRGDRYKKSYKIFYCKKYNLQDWIERYNTSKYNLLSEVFTLFDNGKEIRIHKYSLTKY